MGPGWAPALAAVLGIAGWVLQWRGGDLPAQLHRVGVVAREGFVLWDASWFGGHLTPGYSVLYPLVAARFGIWPVAVLSAVVAAWAFDSLVRRHVPAAGAAPGLWFAAGTVVNLAVGRMTFALGLAMGLLAVLALSHRRVALAAVLSVLTPLASPVAGAFVALAFTAHALVTRQWRLLGLAAAGLAPVAVAAVLFPRGGDFPFGTGALVVTLVACVLVGAGPAVSRSVRVGAGLYGVAALLAYAVSSPLGANVTRMGMFLAWPLLVAGVAAGGEAAWRTAASRVRAAWTVASAGASPVAGGPAGRIVLVVAAPVLLAWQWTPAIDGMVRSGSDRSTEASFHEPLVRFLDAQGGAPFRVEVVPLARHGEAAHVAVSHDLARGWDRQLDREHHPLFYERSLTEVEYRAWLFGEGVRFVALGRAPVDAAGRLEAAVLRTGVEGLQPVLTTRDWQVWEVQGFSDLVQGQGRLVEVGADEVVVAAEAPGPLLVKVRTPGRWSVDGAGCLREPSADGWLQVQASRAGTIELAPAGLEPAGPGCDE